MSDAQETRDDSRKTNTPTRHAKIMRGVVTPILGLIAVACIVFGILNSTIWKPSTHIDAQGQVSGTQYIVTDPGVLDLVDKNVTITVTEQDAPDQDVCIAEGSAKDATGWVQGFSYARIKGLSTWQTLDTTVQSAQGEAKTADTDVPFNTSNMWTQTACGKQTVTMDLKNMSDSRIAIVDLGKPDAKATVHMQWTRTNPPNFALPWYFVGGLFVILAVLAASVFAMPREKLRKMLPHREAKEREPDEVSIGEAVTGTISVLKPRKRNSSKPYKRHAKGARENVVAEQEAPSNGPKIVDTRANNMLAAKNAAAVANAGEETATIQPLIDSIQTPSTADTSSETAAGDDQATAVISDAELQAYFARFARETSEEDAKGLLKINDDGMATGSALNDASTDTDEIAVTEAAQETEELQSADQSEQSESGETASDDSQKEESDADSSADSVTSRELAAESDETEKDQSASTDESDEESSAQTDEIATDQRAESDTNADSNTAAGFEEGADSETDSKSDANAEDDADAKDDAERDADSDSENKTEDESDSESQEEQQSAKNKQSDDRDKSKKTSGKSADDENKQEAQ